jgi:hypothetical protein
VVCVPEPEVCKHSHRRIFYALCSGTALNGNDGAVAVDCNSRRAVGPTKTIRGVYMTQLNRLDRLAETFSNS